MKKIISVLAAAGMAISLLAGCGGSAPAAQPEAAADTGSANAELTLIIASNATDPTNPYSYGLDKFKEVAAMGAADMVVSSPGFMTAIGVPEIDIFSLEYLFDSFDHWEASVDGDFGSAMKDIVQEKTGNQFKIMGYWSSSVRDVYAKQAVTGPQDLKGLSIRTQSAVVQQDFFKNCGAIPTTVAWGELYQALQQGVVDGAETDYTNLTLKEHHKTPNGKYISETHHDYTTRLFLMDGSKYDRLTDEQKEWIDTASKAAQEEEREITYRMFEESKQKAIEEGAVVTEHADIDIDAFKAIAIPIQDSFAEANGMTEQLEMIRNTAK